jgi:hypothetical protein
MKKIGLLTLLLGIIMLNACEKDDEAAKYEVTVTVKYPEGYSKTFAEGIAVKIQNTVTAKISSDTTDANGLLNFNLESGVYSITAVGENAEFAFNATINDTTIASKTDITINLKATSLTGGLVFKEIYYTGSKTAANGSYYSDQFYEIYNNSDSVIYLDGLSIGSLHPVSSSVKSVWLDESGNLSKLPFQQHVWYIPGTGTEHPLQPRTSIIIAQDGINHQTDPAGNSLSPVNLGNADWESYCGDINGGKDADAAGVPNLSLLYTTSTSGYDWLSSVFGPAIVIFKFPKGIDPIAYVNDAANFSTAPGSTSTTKYLLIPKEYVIDAVEAVQTEENKRYKRLPNDLDAGYVYCSGTYVSKSIRRKVKQIIDGKVIYKDTNNSSEDFLGDQTPTPRVNPTSVDN